MNSLIANKPLRFFSTLLLYIASSSLLLAQDFSELNEYKYVVIEENQSVYGRLVGAEIERILRQSNLPIYGSKEELLASNVDPCEILECSYRVGQPDAYPPFVATDIYFYDCNKRLVMNFHDERTSPFVMFRHRYLQEAEKNLCRKSVQKALKKFRYYRYSYVNTGRPAVSPPPNSTPVAVNPSNEDEVNADALPPSDIQLNIPRTQQVNEDAIAVIIGNKSYLDKDIPDVDYALRDARTMKDYLIQTFGFREGNILYFENATQANFNAIFGTATTAKGLLYNYVKPNESDVFVYYTGHGMPDLETKTGFFVPTDCQANLVALNGYALNTFYKNISQVPYKSLTVVIDACFSGASEKGMLIKQASPIFIKSKSQVLYDEKSAVFLSSTNDQVASWYAEKGHSLFTYYFLKAIQGEGNSNRDRNLTIAELKEYIDKEVIYRARRLHNRTQTPEVYGLENKVIVEY